MVYKLHGALMFSTAVARDAALASVTGGVALTLKGKPGLVVDRSDPSASPMQTAYTTLVAAGDTNLAQPGSIADWHACYHGDLVQACAVTARKVW